MVAVFEDYSRKIDVACKSVVGRKRVGKRLLAKVTGLVIGFRSAGKHGKRTPSAELMDAGIGELLFS